MLCILLTCIFKEVSKELTSRTQRGMNVFLLTYLRFKCKKSSPRSSPTVLLSDIFPSKSFRVRCELLKFSPRAKVLTVSFRNIQDLHLFILCRPKVSVQNPASSPRNWYASRRNKRPEPPRPGQKQLCVTYKLARFASRSSVPVPLSFFREKMKTNSKT